MYMYVYMYVCMYACMYARMYMYLHMYVCMYVHVYMYVCMYVYKYRPGAVAFCKSNIYFIYYPDITMQWRRFSIIHCIYIHTQYLF